MPLPTSRIRSVGEGARPKLPFADNTFNAAICFYVGMNIADKAAVIGQAFRVLKPGGKLIWTEAVLAAGEPNYPLPWAVAQELHPQPERRQIGVTGRHRLETA
nr:MULTISPECIES: methyltransferase domain-containing protein [unclassified Mesorhizobium]